MAYNVLTSGGCCREESILCVNLAPQSNITLCTHVKTGKAKAIAPIPPPHPLTHTHPPTIHPPTHPSTPITHPPFDPWTYPQSPPPTHPPTHLYTRTHIPTHPSRAQVDCQPPLELRLLHRIEVIIDPNVLTCSSS